jgi:regulator of sigma E protease
MEMLFTVILSLFALIITIIIVVGFNEFGHFIVARLCGIKVLSFSIGFGKALFRYQKNKDSTEYLFAAIPLGGYVKMLDGREAPIEKEMQHLAFDHQPWYKKAAVIVAGPLFNFILAAFIYWFIFLLGDTYTLPVIGQVTTNSIAAQAQLKVHDQIIAINAKPTEQWMDVAMQMVANYGTKQPLAITTRPWGQPGEHREQQHVLDTRSWLLDDLQPNLFQSLGITPYFPPLAARVQGVQAHSPAHKAGLRAGDHILRIDQTPVHDWFSLTQLIASQPGKTVTLRLERNQQPLEKTLVVGKTFSLFSTPKGYLGISPSAPLWPNSMKNKAQYGPIDAIPHAIAKVAQITSFTCLSLKKILTGTLSLRSLGGPITIAEYSRYAFLQGLYAFLSFLALISINLGIVNLLPIPALDGGQLVFTLLEAVMGKSLSPRTQVLIYKLGLILILVIMIQVIANDITRLLH